MAAWLFHGLCKEDLTCETYVKQLHVLLETSIDVHITFIMFASKTIITSQFRRTRIEDEHLVFPLCEPQHLPTLCITTLTCRSYLAVCSDGGLNRFRRALNSLQVDSRVGASQAPENFMPCAGGLDCRFGVPAHHTILLSTSMISLLSFLLVQAFLMPIHEVN